MEFQQSLKYSMEKQKMTNYRLAKLINVSPSTVANWLNSESLPSIEKLICISKALNISTDFLLTGMEATHNDLAPDEQELLARYRQCNSEGKNYIMYTANMAKMTSASAAQPAERPKKVSERYDEAVRKRSSGKKVSERYDEVTKGIGYVAAYGGGIHTVRNNKENEEEKTSD